MADGTRSAAPATGAVRALARVELRRRWVSLVVLGLLAGLAGAVVTSAVAVARRTSTAPDRLVAATQLEDARVALYGGSVRPEQVGELPGVLDSRTVGQGVAQVTGDALTYTSISAGPDSTTIFTPVVVEGRAARPDRSDEVVVAEDFARQGGVRVGQVLDVKMLTREEITQFDTGFGEPDGPAMRLRVTGLVRVARAWADGNGMAPVIATPAWAQRYHDSILLQVVQLRTDGTSGARDRLKAEVAELASSLELPPDAQEFQPVELTFPSDGKDRDVSAARTALVGGLLVFVAVTALAGLLALGQGIARHHANGLAEQQVEAALGLTRGERTLVRLGPALLGAVTAALVTAAAAAAAARIGPLGALAAFEPLPGWWPQWGVIAAGAAGAFLVFLALAAVTAARVVRSGDAAGARRPGLPAALGVLARRAPIVAGAAFALSGGRGRETVPVRATLITAVAGIAGVLAAGCFSASLQRLDAQPARWGWTADFAWIDAKEDRLAEIVADPRVAAVDRVAESTVALPGGAAPAYAMERRKGALDWTVLRGRLPAASDEITLGPVTARDTGLDVGDPVRVTGAAGPVALTVVGIALTPQLSGEPLGVTSVLTTAGLARAQAGKPFYAALIKTADGIPPAQVSGQLARDLELSYAEPPSAVRNLTDLGRLPMLLGVFLGLVGAAVLAHSLVLTVRRRRQDLGVLRAIGFTPRQVASSLVTMASTTTLIGVAVGVPLGLALGRLAWFEAATGIGVAGDVALPWALVLAVPFAALATALLVAWLPARRASAASPVVALRAE